MSSRRLGYQSLTRMLGHWQQPASRVPLWQQLASALRLLILDGRLTLGTRLPGERELSSALGISRTTVSSALARLREQGFLVSQQGSGSRVVLPESRDTVPAMMSTGVSWTFLLPRWKRDRKFIRRSVRRYQGCRNICPVPVIHLRGYWHCVRLSPAIISAEGCRPVLTKLWWSMAQSVVCP